ncbi:hypothetical protein QF000_005402 [Paraburkholderia atlantica]|uniref:GIY-YIG domain-containing protein n=1 Tax=Paraburkholderia atlantica TaxID=2654982 RepID=A0A7W8V7J9_PARAM|nr:GIY-YIG nuclease family protein [Paraburkholderia atlantica]MBB5426161.1 hypothetical protein [Paraburkholderia atlantica]
MATNHKKSEPLRLIEEKRELLDKNEIDTLPRGLRGIYVLYQEVSNPSQKKPFRNVVYIGMSASGIKGRLRKHRSDPRKSDKWNVCSVFSVWPNVRVDEIRELEGILRHIYRFDAESQGMNNQGTYIKLKSTPDIELNEANRKKVESVGDDEDLAEMYNT